MYVHQSDVHVHVFHLLYVNVHVHVVSPVQKVPHYYVHVYHIVSALYVSVGQNCVGVSLTDRIQNDLIR